MLLLDENDVSSVLDMPSTIRQIESAFQEMGKGKATTPPRFRMAIPNSFGTIRLMAAALQDSRISGTKVLAGTAGHREAERTYFLLLLFDYEDGSIKCVMSASRLTQLRTGAVSAVATKYLARKDSRTLGVIGAGIQGQGQAEAICTVAHVEGGFVYDLERSKAKALAKSVRDRHGVGLEVVENVGAAAKADILSTATTSTLPFLTSSMVKPGTHINAIGSNLPSRKELDVSLLKAAKVVVDSRDQALEESGDLEPVRVGTLPRETLYAELADVVSGKKPGRTSNSEITVFKSVGLALQDVAAAELAYLQARKLGKGRTLTL